MKITYQGPPALTGLFAQQLRDAGLDVSYQPPMEQRGAGEVAVRVVMIVLEKAADEAGGVVMGAALSEAVRKLKGRFPQAKVTDEDGNEIESP